MRLAALAGVALIGIAAPLAAQSPTPPPEYSPVDIALGAQVYAKHCTACHNETGDGVGGIDLRAGKFRSVTTNQQLAQVITTGVPGTGMNAFRTLTAAELSGVVAYLRNMNTFDPASVKVGNAVRGRSVVERRTCLRCHRIDGQGSRVGPDLSDIGLVRSAGSLQRSLVDPSSQMMPINRPVRAVTRDGKVINGRRLNEDTYSVQVIDDQERLLSLSKAELKEFQVLTASPMPPYRDLSDEELADLLAYLLSLQGR